MNEYEDFIEALTIFGKYDHAQGISAEHDEIFAGPDPENVSPEDLTRLSDLGWSANEEYACFSNFV